MRPSVRQPVALGPAIDPSAAARLRRGTRVRGSGDLRMTPFWVEEKSRDLVWLRGTSRRESMMRTIFDARPQRGKIWFVTLILVLCGAGLLAVGGSMLQSYGL